MDTPSPSTASTTAHAVGYNDEPSITAAPLRSTDDLAVDAGQLSSLILTTEATATPQRIVESVTSLTSSGILAEGQRMPTVRDLARLLRTSPATVSSAYHALARSGILRSRGRAGTFVLRQSRTHRYDAGDLLAEAPATAPDRPIIDLSKGTPDLSLLPDIRPFLGKLGTHKAFVNSYDGPTILPMLEQILRRNWPYEPEAMTMASGAGDGLAHTMNAFVQPGDFVITEAPEYPLILDMIEAHGAMAFGVPMDGFGMLPDALDRALTMLESQRLAARRPSGQYNPAAAARPEPYRGQLQPATHRRFGGRAARALPEWRWYAADCGRRSQWRCGQCVCDIVGATIAATRGAYPQFFEVARAGSALGCAVWAGGCRGGDYRPTMLGIGMGEPVPARDSV